MLGHAPCGFTWTDDHIRVCSWVAHTHICRAKAFEEKETTLTLFKALRSPGLRTGVVCIRARVHSWAIACFSKL